MDLREQLKTVGLHGSEIQVYLYLLEQGLSSPPKIAKDTKILRTNCYGILHSLKEKGLIEEQKIGKRKAYLASDPEALVRAIDRRKEAIQKILPDLRGLYTIRKNKPKIRFYDGFEQVKEIYMQTLSAEKILAIGSTKQLSDINPAFYTKYRKGLKEKGIIFSDILTHTSREKGAPEFMEALKGLYDVKFLPQKYEESPTDILVWNDNVALIALQDPMFGTVLTNPLLAQTFRIMFDVMWEGLN